VQACHAIHEADKKFTSPEIHPNVIVLEAKNEDHLHRIAQGLIEQGIDFAQFIEPDIGHQVTAIATQPVHGATRRYFRKFRLLK
jgi:ACT domain-containing protein